MAQAPKATILDHFAELDDPRVERTRTTNWWTSWPSPSGHHQGADSWVHIELFGRSKLAWFQSFLELQPHPAYRCYCKCHDTLAGDVFARLRAPTALTATGNPFIVDCDQCRDDRSEPVALPRRGGKQSTATPLPSERSYADRACNRTTGQSSICPRHQSVCH